MASAPVNVKVGIGASSAGTSASASEPRSRPFSDGFSNQEPERVRRVVVERGPEREDERATSEREQEPTPKKRPTMKEIVERAANVAEIGSIAAENLGAESAADVMRRSADVARKGVVAVESVKREVAPAVSAAKGLWKSMEEKGWVGVREPINIAEMQGRGRPRRVKKSEDE